MSAMLPVFSICLQGRGPPKLVSQYPDPLLDSRGWAHQRNPTLCHSTFHTHLTHHISNTQCPLVATAPTNSNHSVFFGGGGWATSLRYTLNQNISRRLPNGCRRISATCCYRGAGGWYVPQLEWQNLVQRNLGASFSNRIDFCGTKYLTHMGADQQLLFPMHLSMVANTSYMLLGCLLLLQTYGIQSN